MADEKTFKVGDKVRERGWITPCGTVKGFNLMGKVFVVWDEIHNGRGAGMYEPERLTHFDNQSTARKEMFDRLKQALN